MKELMSNLLERIPREDSVLVTIIARTGSTPRGTGAQMLVGQEGRIAGTVGGGAIEAQAILQSQKLLEEKASRRAAFSLEGNSGSKLNMVCGGRVELLFSYIGKADTVWQSVAREALRCLSENQPGALVLGESAPPELVPGEADAPFGGKLVWDRFVLPLPLRQRVIVCGGGHVAQALVPVLAAVDFRVTVFENRPEFANPELFPGAEHVVLGDYEKISDYLSLKADDFFIIMTHGHQWDFTLQEQLLRRKTAYIGVMGSRRKIASVNARLLEAGISQDALAEVHTPIGLPIQAVTPPEIAVSVAAECIAIRAERRKNPSGSCPGCL